MNHFNFRINSGHPHDLYSLSTSFSHTPHPLLATPFNDEKKGLKNAFRMEKWGLIDTNARQKIKIHFLYHQHHPVLGSLSVVSPIKTLFPTVTHLQNQHKLVKISLTESGKRDFSSSPFIHVEHSVSVVPPSTRTINKSRKLENSPIKRYEEGG